MLDTLKEYSLFYVLTLFAEIIGTVSGFGSSIIFVPIASLFFDFDIVLGITAVFHVFSNLSKIALFTKGVNKNIVIKLGIPAVLFVILGAYITQFIPFKELEIGMNLSLLILSGYMVSNQNKKLKQSDKNLVSGGILSGFLAGLFGSGGSIRGITLSSFDLSKESFVATSAIVDLGVDLSRAIIYTANGYVQQAYLILIIPLVFISFLGSYLGKLILDKLSQKTFKYIALGVISITSIVQIILYLLKV